MKKVVTTKFPRIPVFNTDPPFRTSDANNRFDHVMVFVTTTLVFADAKQQLPLFSEMEKFKNTLELKP